LTTVNRPNRLHVKRARKIRKLYNLAKEDDVKFYISKIGREIEKKKDGTDKKKKSLKRPKIQRLITDVRLRRKKIQKSETNKRRERTAKLKEEYHKLIQKLRASAKKMDAKHEEVKIAEPVKKGTDKKGTKAPEIKKDTKAPVTAPKTQTAPKVEPKKVVVEPPKKDDKKATKTSKK